MEKQHTNEALMEPKVKIEIIVNEDNISQRLHGDSNDILYILLFTVNRVMRDGNNPQMNRINKVTEMMLHIIENEDDEELIHESGEIIK